ncbi:hypothetical protein ACFLYF_04730 [Chloroflexota bacterium]
MGNKNKRRIYLFLAGFFILIVARVLIYNAFDKNIVDNTLRLLVSEIYKFFIWVVPHFPGTGFREPYLEWI